MNIILDIAVLYDSASEPCLSRTMESLAQHGFPDVSTCPARPYARYTKVIDEAAYGRVVDTPTMAAWVMVLQAGDVFPPAGHAAYGAARGFMPPSKIELPTDEAAGLPWHLPPLLIDGDPRPLEATLAALPANVTSVVLPVFLVEDSASNLARGVSREARIVRRAAAAHVTPYGFYPDDGVMAVMPGLPICHQPASAYLYEQGNLRGTMEAASPEKRQTIVDRRVFLKARNEAEAREAVAALRVLFTHMSLSEELWRLREIMKLLPYTIEDRVGDLRELLQKQIGHLEGKDGEAEWYRDGSPAEVIDASYPMYTAHNPQRRVRWMVEEARKRGYKRVLELGSVDGVNLFTYEMIAPEIEWHGVEINPRGKAHADKLCAQLGRSPLKMYTASFDEFAFRCCDRGSALWDEGRGTVIYSARRAPVVERFDAAAVFEVLEHNFDPNPILGAAERCVRPGGRVFITTPDGNWSAHDEPTRVVDLRKDHVCAYTVKRMRALLEARGAKDIEVWSEENPTIAENNGWVFASYEV